MLLLCKSICLQEYADIRNNSTPDLKKVNKTTSFLRKGTIFLKKIILIIFCVGIGLSTGSWVVLQQQKQPEEESWKDGHVITRHVGTSISNTAAIEELVKQFPFSESLDDVSITGTTVRMTYRVTGKERVAWTGSDTEDIKRGSPFFLESRLPKLIMHHTLGLFLSVSDLSELRIEYNDPFTEVVFDVDRSKFEEYTPKDIDRASSSADRFNRVVVEDYILVDSRRAAFFEKFVDALRITPEN